MIVYQLENPDYGWITYKNLADALEEIGNEIEANSLPDETLTIEIRIKEMSQAELDALPEIEM